jgi:OFA family oxalate/formate antiporter-like MFS transporter
MKRFISAVLPAFLLAVSVGQIYAFTNFSDGIAEHISTADNPVTKAQVQFAFSLGIFFLGMGAAFFGKIVEKNIRLSTIIGTTLFISGLLVTQLGIVTKSLILI